MVYIYFPYIFSYSAHHHPLPCCSCSSFSFLFFCFFFVQCSFKVLALHIFSFIALISPKAFSVIHSSKLIRLFIYCFTLSFLPLICLVSVKFSVFTFLVMCPRYIKCLVLRLSVLFVSICSKTTSFPAYSVYGILSIIL